MTAISRGMVGICEELNGMTSAGITNLINYLAEVEPLRKQWRETKTAKTVTTPFIKLEKELKQLYKTKK